MLWPNLTTTPTLPADHITAYEGFFNEEMDDSKVWINHSTKVCQKICLGF